MVTCYNIQQAEGRPYLCKYPNEIPRHTGGVQGRLKRVIFIPKLKKYSRLARYPHGELGPMRPSPTIHAQYSLKALQITKFFTTKYIFCMSVHFREILISTQQLPRNQGVNQSPLLIHGIA